MLSSILGRIRVAQALVVITRNSKKEVGSKKEGISRKEVSSIKEESSSIEGSSRRGGGSLKEPTDPVQKLFVDKLREYRRKSAGAELVDPSPAILKELDKEYKRLYKNYGGGPNEDMISFPTFKFEEPVIDPIDELTPEEKKKKKEEEEKKKARKKK